MADIFVSYSQKDRDRVRPVVRALESRGWSVWWDAHGVAGEVLDAMVDRELEQATCVMVVWSEDSVGSDWVHGEVDEARAQRRLVPIAIDDVAPPRRFRSTNTISLIDWNGSQDTPEFRRILGGLEVHLGAQDLPSANPEAEKVSHQNKKPLNLVKILCVVTLLSLICQIGEVALEQSPIIFSLLVMFGLALQIILAGIVLIRRYSDKRRWAYFGGFLLISGLSGVIAVVALDTIFEPWMLLIYLSLNVVVALILAGIAFKQEKTHAQD